MMKFFVFGSLAHLYLIVSSSVMPQYGDIEQKQYVDFKLMSAFRKYLTVPTHESYSSFRSYTLEYYGQSPIDCLNLLDRYRSNWVFKVVFWHALAGSYEFIDHTKITQVYYSKVLEWISRRIRWTLFNCSCSDESDFKTELETVSLMIKLAERSSSELRSLGIDDEIISGNGHLVATCRYLIENISINFTNKTIDYHSLLRIFNETSILIKTDSSSNGPSLHLSKRYTLLWFYMLHIYNSNFNVIFDINHHHKSFFIYLVMEILGTRCYRYDTNELYPNVLRSLIEKLYKNGSPQLEPILALFKRYNLERDHNLLGISEKFSNYIELARLIIGSSKKYCPSTTWKVRALAELEAYLIQRGRKVEHSTK